MSLDALFRPSAIAVVGASARRSSNGFIVTNNLVNHRYGGQVIPVNPRLDHLLGLPAAASLKETSDVDLAVLMIRSELLADVYLEAAEAGVGAVTIAGDLPADPAERDRIFAALAAGGPRILGAGSMGLIDRERSVMASMSSALLGGSLPRGGLALLSQSGGLLGSLVNRAVDHGLGVSKAVSLGQESDVSLGELLTYLADDPGTTTIGCVVEGLRDVDAFVSGVERAHATDKQVSVYRIGRSQAGQRSALAHSGALAVPNRTYAGFFRQLGVLEVDSAEELLDVVYAAPSLRQSGIAAVGAASLSGGCCGAFADACEAAGVELAELSPTTLGAVGLDDETAHNPVDLVSNAVGPEATETVLTAGLRALDADPGVSVVAYADSMLLPIDEVADTLVAHQRRADKPLVVAWSLGSQAAPAFGRLQQARVPTFRSLAVAARWLRLVSVPTPAFEATPPCPEEAAEVARGLPVGRSVATEAELAPALVQLGVPMVSATLARSAEEAGAAADAHGAPVALKVVSPALLHRHAVGALALGLRDRVETEAAARALLAAHPLRGNRDALLVQPMVDIADEYFVGLHRDEQFGLLLVVGRGGVDVESDGEVLVRRLPLDPGGVAAMVHEVAPEAPVAAITDVAVRVAELGSALGDRLLSLEINPLVRRAGDPDHVLGVDALATFAPDDTETTSTDRTAAPHEESHA